MSIDDQLAEWGRGAQALALLDAAFAQGWITFLAEPRDLASLAKLSQQDPDRVRDVLGALVANGIAVAESGRYRLAPDVAAAVAGDAPMDLGAKVANARLVARQVENVVRTGAAPLTAQEAVVVARSFAFRAGPGSRAVVTMLFEPMPEMWEAMRDGRLLDVGSGVGGFVLTAATMLPGMRATTLEVVPEVAAVAAARAKDLGVDDRIDVRCMDARDFVAAQAYDVAFWAQPFFPADARAATLATIRRSLRPGGLLLVQELEAPSEGPGFALRRLVAQAQGIPFARTIEDLVAECADAGFVDARVITSDFGRVALLTA
ncbi:SAM-dependent methyltransferase [Actinoplanes sp. NPDC051513]|uniref:SAM-dependent methyltransferase n=1 Tax=Actinoplanes sp. NPDC051513 TaxID=3363908 RepID=UPI0037B146CC